MRHAVPDYRPYPISSGSAASCDRGGRIIRLSKQFWQAKSVKMQGGEGSSKIESAWFCPLSANCLRTWNTLKRLSVCAAI